jgi:hypothetical protein
LRAIETKIRCSITSGNSFLEPEVKAMNIQLRFTDPVVIQKCC